jgi:elongation factor Ts
VAKSGATLVGFDRFQLGEGIEKQASDFAAEVAATAGITTPDPGKPEPQG